MKRSEKQQRECQGQRRRRGGGAPGIGSEIPCSLWKRPGRAEGKHEEGGEAERNCYILTINPVPNLPVLLGVGRRVGRDIKSGKGGRKGVGLIFVFLFFTTWISNYIFILTGNKLIFPS